ncbi:heme o synthase [Advenella sp. RU8]|uniref:heme o synthase n=1 Tax=Advenella sp. RU8 TaxID=3399575 RepID=UPI003AAEDF9A
MTIALTAQTRFFQQYWVLTKPRVTQLAVFCAVIGMFLASNGLPPASVIVAGTLGIWLLAAAAFAINCLIEQEIDARMLRTRRRATAQGTITSLQVVLMSGMVGGLGMLVLYWFVNPLTMWLTFATFIGYALIYTIVLKPLTPQNIVIGGLSGAMPPALGWAAVAGSVPAEAWLLVLIIFAWTPPHFWALALYRSHDYQKSGLPMLPITHGNAFTRLHILLYTFMLVVITLMPFIIRMSGLFYLAAALFLGAWFIKHAFSLYKAYSDELARKTFRFSILYLALLFGALLVDHWIMILMQL